jgi:plasmid stabilization system protein ParE
MNNYEIIWSESAVNQLDSILRQLKDVSQINAQQFLEEIIAWTAIPANMPFRFPACKLLPTKYELYRNGNYLNQYQIIYRIALNEVIILAIIHKSRYPAERKK